VKTLLIVSGLLFLTACAVPMSGPTYTTPLSPGMTMDDVKKVWGPPLVTTWYDDAYGRRIDLWRYQSSQKIIMPRFGGSGHPTSHREYQNYTLTFRDGALVGFDR
jgi:hypothetical protein